MQTQHLPRFLTLLAVNLLLAANTLFAQPGTLDPTFGNGGKVITPGRVLNCLAIQPDGKLVAAGAYVDSSTFTYKLLIVRYNTNGIIDSSFGNNGLDTFSFNLFASTAHGIVLQTDGKIVVGGYFNNGSLAILRLNTNGSPDSSFGTNGVQTITDRLPLGSYAESIVLQNDGKIVAGGYCNDPGGADSPSGLLLVRLNTNGSFDSSFGNNGLDTVRGLYGGINALTLQTDQKIIAAGLFGDSVQGETPLVARYLTNGELDSSFGTNGIDTAADGNKIRTENGVVLQSDGKIIVAGYGSINSDHDNFALVRYNTDGTIDSTFGIPTLTFYGENSNAYALALETDGKIVVAGCTNALTGTSQPSSFAIARYLSTGLLDSSFGINGIDTTYITNVFPPFGYQIAYAMQLTSSRIYLAGTDGVNGAIAAYANDGNVFPITYLNFDGVLQGNNALLTWSTANETNNKGFEVEKSMNGQTFTGIGFVPGHGNASSVNNYNYTDVKVASGNNYYRLKQVDNDGRFTYSSVIQLNYSKFDWSVFGNPVTNNSWLQLQLDQASNVTIQVLSINGALMQTTNKGNIQAGAYSIPLNLAGAASGMYLVRLIVNDQAYSKIIIK